MAPRISGPAAEVRVLSGGGDALQVREYGPVQVGVGIQHAPDEHLLAPLARQALQLMAGLFWDLGESPPPA